jgi:hypothetical protein
MKKSLTTAVLLIILGTAAFAKGAVAVGKTHSAFGDYRIEKADNRVIIDGKDCKTYKISYENTPLEVTVVVKREKGSRKYAVLSDKLSVQYKWDENFFGVGLLDNSLSNLGKTNDENLNREQYFRQKVLCPGLLPDRESTRMIAAFFPLLVNPDAALYAGK